LDEISSAPLSSSAISSALAAAFLIN
jgi:hypothetical protein